MVICVYGAASDAIDDYYKRETEGLGREIARRKHSLIYGAGSTGLMGAAARGASEEHGEIIGVAPAFMQNFEPVSKLCTDIIRTETMAERKAIMEANADAFIITPGGVGTFDEFFQLLTLIELGRKSAPVAVFNIDGYYNEIIISIEAGVEKGFIRKAVRDMLFVSTKPAEIIRYFENWKAQEEGK